MIATMHCHHLPAVHLQRKLLIHGDIVLSHRSHRILGVVDTVGRSLVNVVRRDGSHRAYPVARLDVAA